MSKNESEKENHSSQSSPQSEKTENSINSEQSDQSVVEKEKNLESQNGQQEQVDDITNLKKEIEELKEKNLRTLADLDNQRKDYEKERELTLKEIRKYGNQELLKQLLFFPDSYEMALKFGQNESDPKIKNFLAGFQMVLSQFQNILHEHGIEEIKVIPYQDIYNTKLHNAQVVEKNSEYPDKTVLEILRKGYLIHQRVLRPAEVKISSENLVEDRNTKSN
jgi:molecular chaperone GrpE